MRSPEGEYSERHLPIDPVKAYTITVRDRERPGIDDAPRRNGKPTLRSRIRTLYYDDDVHKPTPEELEAAHAHAEHEAHAVAALEGHSADGHQFDGHHLAQDEPLRGEHE
jgi:ubiquinol-cytochrome c reductase cytochrome b subunit